jgi:hypothetical protein
MLKRLNSSLSDFSKGAVTPKYRIVEMKRSIRYMSWVVILFELIWFIGWMFLVIRFDNWWFGLPILVPVLFRGRMHRMFIRWNEVGLITLHDDKVTLDIKGSSKEFQLRDQRMIKLWNVVTDSTGSSSHLPHFAMVVGIQFDRNQEFLVLNEMHLTAQDKLQFMEPPPSFGTLMFKACRNHDISVLTKKGEPWSDWLEAR